MKQKKPNNTPQEKKDNRMDFEELQKSVQKDIIEKVNNTFLGKGLKKVIFWGNIFVLVFSVIKYAKEDVIPLFKPETPQTVYTVEDMRKKDDTILILTEQLKTQLEKNQQLEDKLDEQIEENKQLEDKYDTLKEEYDKLTNDYERLMKLHQGNQ